MELVDIETRTVLCRTVPLNDDSTGWAEESPEARHLDDALLAALLTLHPST
jgi:hypothetical protein